MRDDTVVWLAVLGIGGYFAFTYLSDWLKGLTKPLEDIVGGIVDTGGKIVDIGVSPITPAVTLPPTSLTPSGATITPPSPINYAFPPSGIPGFIDFTQTGSKWVLGNILDVATTLITGKQPSLKTTYKPPSTVTLLKASPIPSISRMAETLFKPKAAFTASVVETTPAAKVTSTLLSSPITVIAATLSALAKPTTAKAAIPTKIIGAVVKPSTLAVLQSSPIKSVAAVARKITAKAAISVKEAPTVALKTWR